MMYNNFTDMPHSSNICIFLAFMLLCLDRQKFITFCPLDTFIILDDWQAFITNLVMRILK